MRRAYPIFIGLIAAMVAVVFALAPGSAQTARAATLMQPPTNNGLVGWWTFDEGAGGYAHDFSGNANLATLAGGASFGAGRFNRGVILDGATGYIEIPNSNSLAVGNQDWTVSAWVKTTMAAQGVVVARGGASYSYYLAVNASGQPVFDVWTSPTLDSVTGPNVVNDGKWHHLVGAFNSSTMYLYVDGVQYTGPGQWIAANPAENTEIGYDVGSTCCGANFFAGTIDDVREYNRVISAAEVNTLYHAGQLTRMTVSQNGLAGWWTFDEGTSTKAHDFSGNGNTGTLTNGPAWVQGKRGMALSFSSASSQYVDVGNNASLKPTSGAITVSAWVKLVPNGNHQVIFSHSSGAYVSYLHLNAGNYYICWAASEVANNGCYNYSTLILPNDGKWHLVTQVNQIGSSVTAYLDGVAVQTTGFANTYTYNYNAHIGHSVEAGNFYSNSPIDDVRVYTRALSAGEIAKLYTEGAMRIGHSQETAGPTAGLVGYWSFNGIDTNWANGAEIDRSGNGNTGSLANMSQSASPAPGRVGQAFKFDGSTSVVTIPNSTSLDLNGAVTMSAWIKTSATTDYAGIIQKSDSSAHGYQVGFSTAASQILRCDLFNGASYTSVSNAKTVVDGKWHHIVCTYDGNTAILYIDDVANPFVVGAGFVVPSGLPVTIGNDRCCGTARHFNGSIDEVRIYNRALTAAEVKQLYRLGK